MRLDMYLHRKGYADSRAAAQRLIKEGQVHLDGVPIEKPAYLLPEDGEGLQARLTVGKASCPYVSRGGLKLEAAIRAFCPTVAGKAVLDIGASTGGFTDCLLAHGARTVYAVDSGRGQLHPRLLADARVVSIESFNARYMKKEDFPEPLSLAVMDVSFISQTLLHPAIADVLTEEGVLISLIKPQFEVGRSAVGRGGIVKKEADRLRAVDQVTASMEALGFRTEGVIPSPILGGDGNTEYLACFWRIRP